MSGGFILTDPGALRFLLLIPVLVLLYMVRSRYRRRQVSSTMLWRSHRRDLEARHHLRLPPISLLMLLQLLAVALGAAALARPALQAQERTHLVVVVDMAASMGATDAAPSRFEVALHLARQAIGQLEPGDEISLVQMGSSPALLASGSERAGALAALDHLRPGSGTPDVAAALRLAESLIHQTGGLGKVLLLSDGVFGAYFRPPTLDVPVEFTPIGGSGENQGITAIGVRPDMDGSGRWSAFARVANFAGQPVEITATATADDLLLDSRRLRLAARGTSELSFALPPGARSFAMALNTSDILAVDDRAEIRVDAPRERAVLVVSRDADPIEKVLGTLPGLKVSTVAPADYQGAAGADLVVLDNFVPANLPEADLLILNPPIEAPGFVTDSDGGEAPVLRSLRGSRLIESVDLQSLRLGQMVRLQTPEWAHAIVEGPGGPLILEGDRSGRRVVVFDFDWMLYDLPRMQAFPLLLSNAVAELNPLSLPASVQPGESVLLRPVADAEEVVVELPNGARRHLSLAHGALGFAETDQAGRYTVRWRGPGLGEVANSFSVNVTSNALSDLAPLQYTFGEGAMARGIMTPVPGRQLWPALALLLLGLLSVEWLYFARRS